MAIVARRARTEAEVRQALARKGYTVDEVAEAVERLRGWRYIADDTVAERAASRAVSARKGRRSVARELSGRGVGASVAAKAIEEQFGGRDEELLEQAFDEAVRRLGGIRSLKEASKIARRLIGRGFEPGAVFDRLRRAGLSDEE